MIHRETTMVDIAVSACLVVVVLMLSFFLLRAIGVVGPNICMVGCS